MDAGFATHADGGPPRGRAVRLPWTGSEPGRPARPPREHRAYAEREKTQSGQFAEEYIRHFLEDEGIPGIEYEYQLVQQIAGTVTLAEVNKLASNWITDENRVIIAQVPVKEGVAIPTESSLLAVFDRAQKAPVVAWTETVSTEALLPNAPAAGKIVSSKALPNISGVEWKLSNGSRVIVKPGMDQQKAYSPYPGVPLSTADTTVPCA